MADDSYNGVQGEMKQNSLESRTDRYARTIGRCTTKDELCALVKVINSARLTEREFSALFALAAKRAVVLKKEATGG